MQIELLTKYDIAGKTKIPVQGHGQIIGINATMGFVILNFLILVALLYGLLWNPVTKMLDDRAGSIRRDIEQASASREDAEKLRARYEQALANARSEASRLRQEKVREGDAQKDKIISHARQEARRLTEDAKAQVEAALTEAKRELRKEVGGISVDIAAQILDKEVDQEVHRKLIDDFLRNLETEKV
jgi:F-type H+-transporting ATPase subunit b